MCCVMLCGVVLCGVGDVLSYVVWSDVSLLSNIKWCQVWLSYLRQNRHCVLLNMMTKLIGMLMTIFWGQHTLC